MSKTSVRDIVSVLFADPSLGRAAVEDHPSDPSLRLARISFNNIDLFLVSFSRHVGKNVRWTSVYKRLRRAGFLLEAESGDSRVFVAALEQEEQVNQFLLHDNDEDNHHVFEENEHTRKRAATATATAAAVVSMDGDDAYEAAMFMYQLMKQNGSKPPPWRYEDIAPPIPCIIMPEGLDGDADEVHVAAVDLKPTMYIKNL